MFTRFLPLSVYGDFSRRPRAANSAVLGPTWPNFELVRDVMDVLITCKYEEDPIKNRGARVFITLYVNFSDTQGQITLESVVVSSRNLNSSKLPCMSSLPARMRMIESKMKELECSQDYSHYKSMGIFPDAQGQLNPQSLVRSGRISNSSEMLWMFSLPASMKKIRLKMKALECSQHFPIITLWELSVAMDTRVPVQSGPKPNAAFPPPNDVSVKIWLRSAHGSQEIFMFENVYGRTDGRTPARLVNYKLTFEPSAQVS